MSAECSPPHTGHSRRTEQTGQSGHPVHPGQSGQTPVDGPPAGSSAHSSAQEGILRRQSARESAARTYARALPIVPVRARGMTIEGADGRRYLDCLSGAGTLALGHNHPVVLEAIRKVLDSGAPLHVLDLATPVKDDFTTELFGTLPRGLAERARIQFCGPAGTDAVEAALKLVRAATGREGLLAFTGAYHGMTAGALEASGGAQDVRVARLPYPQDYRCPFGLGGANGAELSARWTESLLDDTKSGVPAPAGMILEPVQGEGGVLPAPDAWLRRMREITAARGIPLIADEVQTGVGRTGTFWAVEHSGVVPDVMVLSKAIGGSLPLAVVIYRDDLDVWPPGAHAGTFRGNQLAMAAGAATLAYVRENGLAERAAVLGARMLAQLRSLAADHPCVGEVRGRGLMLGVELVEAAEPVGPAEPVDPAGFSGPVGPIGPTGFSGHVDAVEPGPEGTSGTSREASDRGSAHGSPAGPGAADQASAGREDADRAATPYDPLAGGAGILPSTTRPRPPAPQLAAAVQRECLRRGLIVELGGRHSSVVRLLPPLTITDEQAAAVLDRLADALATAARAHHG
ncbi:aminotransferase class III-fold pyridoxal phosphate-dependent enzyme [Streptomyces alboniger]|uniref:Diaminobutyrate--2-oxoglutarate transaminase n=1 Tax=Streptomyces alboniger TaxID=132473 RepID=A0A5J6HUW1_STRAD|nr:aminotransferase class III-fold pyridoxal phosphate-dependent enzyme [Streptomyces alboniger]